MIPFAVLERHACPLPTTSEGKRFVDIIIAVIASWLSVNFALPATVEAPLVQLVTTDEMQAIRMESAAGQGQLSQAILVTNGAAPSVEAFYSDATRTIYLERGWLGESPADVSVLVHEMVHHIQNAGNLTYACPQAREAVAYSAQQQWLAMFGSDLGQTFELDPMTILVRTTCAM
jgi:hypothetical protein